MLECVCMCDYMGERCIDEGEKSCFEYYLRFEI